MEKRTNPIRKPGESWELSDQEILAAPSAMLSRAQRARRRNLKRKIADERRAEQRLARRQGRAARLATCMGYTKTGRPCESPPMAGVKHCRVHLNDAERAKLGMPTIFEEKERERLRVKPRSKTTAPALMREVTEVAVEKLVYRYFRAVGLEFVGFDEIGNPIVLDKGVQRGICIHGESKDGDIHMSEYPDLAAQVQIMEKLFDRVYGKPKQTQVLEGGVRPVQVQPVRTIERAQGMAEILARSGALPPAPPTIDGEALEIEPARTNDEAA